MSHMLEFPPVPQPSILNCPPYVVFGIHGIDISSSLPPLIPLGLVLHFAPALRKWVLPAPDPAYVPRSIARHALRTPYIGIDILTPIDAVGLSWIITCMLHLGSFPSHREVFSVRPNLGTSLAIHNAWLALKLPFEGLRGLHTHIYAQLILGSPAICLWDMRMLWDTLPHDSDIVRAMGLNFVQAHVNLEFKMQESLEILAWFRSTPELYAFFKGLQDMMSDYEKDTEVHLTAAEERETIVGTGYKTIGRKAGKAIKAAVAAQADQQVDVMRKDATRKVSPYEGNEREASDFEALRARLMRTRSDDSLRSVDTAIWDPQKPEEEEEEEEEDEQEEASVDDGMNDSNNYTKGSISAALASSLETIRIRREARLAKNKHSNQSSAEELTSANLELHSTEDQSFSQLERLRHRRSSSATTTGKEHGLSLPGIDKRIQELKAKQRKLRQGSHEGASDDEEGKNAYPGQERMTSWVQDISGY